MFQNGGCQRVQYSPLDMIHDKNGASIGTQKQQDITKVASN